MLPKPWTPLAKATSMAPGSVLTQVQVPQNTRPHEGPRVRAPDSHREDKIDVILGCSSWGCGSSILFVQIVLGENKVLVDLKF